MEIRVRKLFSAKEETEFVVSKMLEGIVVSLPDGTNFLYYDIKDNILTVYPHDLLTVEFIV